MEGVEGLELEKEDFVGFWDGIPPWEGVEGLGCNSQGNSGCPRSLGMSKPRDKGKCLCHGSGVGFEVPSQPGAFLGFRNWVFMDTAAPGIALSLGILIYPLGIFLCFLWIQVYPFGYCFIPIEYCFIPLGY